MANGPALLLADEPTSQLDAASGADTIELIRAANRDFGMTIIAVTHDPAVATALGRTITIRDGRVGSAGHGGREFLVVGRDRSVQLPAEFAELLPPGSLLSAERLPDGVALRRVAPDSPGTPMRPVHPARRGSGRRCR